MKKKISIIAIVILALVSTVYFTIPSPIVGECPEGRVVSLAWDEADEADSYNVYWSDTKGVNRNNGNKVSTKRNSVVITGLEDGTTYYFVVTSVNETGESKESEEVKWVIK